MSQETTNTNVEGVIVDAIAGFGLDASEITRAAPLADLDIDSLDLAELSQIIYDRLGVEIAAEDLPQLSTVGDLVSLVEARR